MPRLLVFTVTDRPRHVGADLAVAALLDAFPFPPVVVRHARGPVVTFCAEVPDVQLAHLPRAVTALSALTGVENVAVVPLPRPTWEPAVASSGGDAGVPCGEGGPPPA